MPRKNQTAFYGSLNASKVLSISAGSPSAKLAISYPALLFPVCRENAFARIAVADDQSGMRDVLCDSPSAACSECCTSQEATGSVGYCLRIPGSGFYRRAVRATAALHAIDGERDLPETGTRVDHETQPREVPSATVSSDMISASVAVSMSKLFDLMVMVCKFYTLHCTEASLLLQVRSAVLCLFGRPGAKVTLKHLSEVSKLLERSEDIARMEALRERLFEAYSGLSSWRWYVLWSEMLSPLRCSKISVFHIRNATSGFFQDSRVKVSVLIQLKVQKTNGQIVLPRIKPPIKAH